MQMKGSVFKMKQEQFKYVYQNIYLSEQQKGEIWKRIVTMPDPVRKKAFLPTRIAVCLGVLLMSGMTVFAANELSLIDKISEAMSLLTQNKSTLTEEQKNLYEQYGQVLDNEIELDNGTLTLDAAMYDENQLLIPFRYIFHPDVESYEDLTAGAEIDDISLHKTRNRYRQDTNTFLYDYSFRVMQGSEKINGDMGCCLITNPAIAETGVLTGCLLLNTHESSSFEPGYVIQLVRTAKTNETAQTDKAADEKNIYELCTEFTLGKALEQRELTISAENAAALEDMGISVERMSISPLSVCYSGKGTHTKAFSASVTVVLKDGRVVEPSPTGGGYALSDANRNNTSFSFYAAKLFSELVPLEDIAEIHIQDHRNADINIPIQAK